VTQLLTLKSYSSGEVIIPKKSMLGEIKNQSIKLELYWWPKQVRLDMDKHSVDLLLRRKMLTSQVCASIFLLNVSS
jgi:hypothetical protein